jgi:hypothetical protein
MRRTSKTKKTSWQPTGSCLLRRMRRPERGRFVIRVVVWSCLLGLQDAFGWGAGLVPARRAGLTGPPGPRPKLPVTVRTPSPGLGPAQQVPAQPGSAWPVPALASAARPFFRPARTLTGAQ